MTGDSAMDWTVWHRASFPLALAPFDARADPAQRVGPRGPGGVAGGRGRRGVRGRWLVSAARNGLLRRRARGGPDGPCRRGPRNRVALRSDHSPRTRGASTRASAEALGLMPPYR